MQTYHLTYRRSSAEPERKIRLKPSETAGPQLAYGFGRYHLPAVEGEALDWLQGAKTEGQLFQQLHAKFPVREGGYLLLESDPGVTLWAHPRSKAAELGCKCIGDLVPVHVESNKARQERVKAAKESAKAKKLEGWV